MDNDIHIVRLLHELSPHITGLERSKQKKTLTLNPFFSSCVGFNIFEGNLYLGFPSFVFEKLYKIRVFNISYIKNHSAFFIVMDCGKGEGKPFALRLFLRKDRVKLLENFNSVILKRMDANGNAGKRAKDSHRILLRKITSLEWE
jgi:hypothetical protein